MKETTTSILLASEDGPLRRRMRLQGRAYEVRDDIPPEVIAEVKEIKSHRKNGQAISQIWYTDSHGIVTISRNKIK